MNIQTFMNPLLLARLTKHLCEMVEKDQDYSVFRNRHGEDFLHIYRAHKTKFHFETVKDCQDVTRLVKLAFKAQYGLKSKETSQPSYSFLIFTLILAVILLLLVYTSN